MIGLCLPARPLPGPTSVPPGRWGCLRAPVVNAIWEQLSGHDIVPIEFRDADLRSGGVYEGDRALHELDAVFWYCEVDRTPGSFEQEVLQTLALHTHVAPDPHRWAIGVDKYRAHRTLQAAGLPVPKFALIGPGGFAHAERCLAEWGPVAIKPRTGAWGEGVLLVEHAATLRDALGYMQAVSGKWPDGGVLLEQWLDNDPAQWTSVTVIGGEPIFGYRKRANKWVELPGGRHKVFDEGQQGGSVDLAVPTPHQADIAARAAAVLGLPIVGFDMIHTASGPVIVDANTSPGNYPELYEQVGRDIARVFAKAILSACADRD